MIRFSDIGAPYSGGIWLMPKRFGFVTVVKSLIPATVMGVTITFTPVLHPMTNFAWFTGCLLGSALYFTLTKREQARQRVALSMAGSNN